MARSRAASTKSSSRGLANKGDVTKVQVTIDTAKKKRFEALLADMSHSRRDEASGFDAYWEAVDDILRNELFIAGGFATADAFVREVVKVPLRSALRNVRIARHASPAEEAKFGTALLDAAIGFIEAKAGGTIEGPLPVAFDKLRIPLADSESSSSRKSVALAEATVDQVRAATKALLGTTNKAPSKRSATEQAIVHRVHATSALRAVTVSVREGKVRLGAFPLELIGELGRALSQVELPAEETKAPKKGTKQPVSGPAAPAKPAAKKAAGGKPKGPKDAGAKPKKG